ncbi:MULTISPECIES: ribonucleotide-diphosphate reductase subunit beta [Bacillaceae]|uniref:Ribonucleoside-diphosphate reductase subunit beta n=1 Tax=Bacillus infantis NRRL B-14911 TaxID=1367477 RepID=U5L427_9BACI|nr:MULTISPECIES: ribonucleotide-diphosphate reductase subunit beta [Bacillus]AGX02019.1 ribonucleotide-diphosphate reductase subunit beta [Bacillus infantis NRRL B-14911]MCA1035431.1 ribonucleotide-diphosphate reductase subunit beta [Bacillus infantis]MDW2878091.1 ribonucleotide-diphosphate reductase subunit beta [Bacillus infantis]
MTTPVNKREIMNKTAPNRSTGIINGECSNILNWDDVRFQWAFPKYKRMLANFWTPFEINMSQDIKQFPDLSEEEKEAFLKIIGLLALLDSIQTDYAGKVADYLTDSSLSALMIILAQQEVIHNHSYSYVLSSIVDKNKQDEVFEFWRTEPALIKRNEFVASGYRNFAESPTVDSLLKSIIFDVVLEGLFFYSGFAFFYHLARNQKMVATSTMINYINRDEQLHVDLFVKIFREILDEYPEQNTKELAEFAESTFREAAYLEIEWARSIIGDKISGILIGDVEEYIRFYANVRSNQLGFNRPFEGSRTNPLRWIKAYEEVDLGKSDFFEQKPRQYVKVNTVDNGFDDL